MKKRGLFFLNILLVISMVFLYSCDVYELSGDVKTFDLEPISNVTITTNNTQEPTQSDENGNWYFKECYKEGILNGTHDEYVIYPMNLTINNKSEFINLYGVDTIAKSRIISNELTSNIDESDKETTLGGVVTAIIKYKSATNIIIQENLNNNITGLTLRVNSTSNDVRIGDQIVAKGHPSTYYGLDQLAIENFQMIKILSSNSTFQIQELTSNELNSENGENYESEFVKIINATVTEIDKYGNVSIEANGELYKADPQETSWFEVGTTYKEIRGFVNYNYNEYKIVPRNSGDIIKEVNEDEYLSKKINQIQGNNHKSPLVGEKVSTTGIVLGTKGNQGFYIQTKNADDNINTSEGIYILSGDKYEPGTKVKVYGTVEEYADPEETLYYNPDIQLTLTSIRADVINVISINNQLPQALKLGIDRQIPSQYIDNDGLSSFDPNEDAADFYESIEGMYVAIEEAVVVGPSKYGVTYILSNNGNNVSHRTNYGGVSLLPDTLNPQIIHFENESVVKINHDGDYYADSYDLGTKFDTTLYGIVGYEDTQYMVYNAKNVSESEIIKPTQERETTTLTNTNNLRIASYNLYNFSAKSDTEKKALSIVNNLSSPDIISLMEVQDNSGEEDNGSSAANETYQKLIDAIVAVGGPEYKYININPELNQDGGVPGGNIRVGFLYNPNIVTFNQYGNANYSTTASISLEDGKPKLNANPVRIDPNNNAFYDSRKSLVAQFQYKGEPIFVIANHFCSKGGDDPAWSNIQPPVNHSEEQRKQQAEAINSFIKDLLAADSEAKIVVCGDLNDFDFSQTLQTLKGDELVNTIDSIPLLDRYTYIYQGNSQVLDHILLSHSLKNKYQVDIVHMNTMFAKFGKKGIISDHDVVIIELDM